jgi:hypothetical protein
MASELESLLVRLEGDTTALRRALKDAESGVDGFENKTNASLSKQESRYKRHADTVGSSLKGMFAAIGAIVAVNGVSQLAKDTVELGKAAEKAGLSAAEYQRLAGAVREVGVNSSQFAAGMQKFTEGVAQARLKSGEFYDFLRKQAPTVLDQINATDNQVDALRVYANAVQASGSAENQALLVKKAFGDIAMDLTAALKLGAAGFDDLAKAGGRYSAVVSDSAIKNTSSLVKEFDALRASVSSAAQELIGAIAPPIESGLSAAGEYFTQFRGVATSSLKVATADAMALADSLGLIGKATETASSRLSGFASFGKNIDGGFTTTVTANPLKEKTDNTGANQIAALRQQLAAAKQETFEAIRLSDKQETDKLKQQLAERLISQQEYNTSVSLIAQTTEAKIANERRSNNEQLLGLKIQAADAEQNYYTSIGLQYERDLEAYKQLLAQKRISAAEFEDARANLTAVASSKIKQQMTQEAEEIRSRFSQLESSLNSALSELPFAFSKGKEAAADFFASFAKQISQAVTQALILKPIMDSLFGAGGAANSFLGSLLPSTGGIPARAEGGAVMGGVPYLIGERGKAEVFVPDTSGRVVPAARFGSSGGGSGGASYTTVNNIDARGAAVGVEQRLLATMAAVERQRQSAPAAVATTANRFPARR